MMFLQGGCECAGEKAKQTMDNVLGAAKEGSEKLKDRAAGTGTGTCTGTSAGTGTGTGTGTSKPSKDPDMNHGVESTDSSCEDVRGRPGGYNWMIIDDGVNFDQRLLWRS